MANSMLLSLTQRGRQLPVTHRNLGEATQLWPVHLVSMELAPKLERQLGYRSTMFQSNWSALITLSLVSRVRPAMRVRHS